MLRRFAIPLEHYVNGNVYAGVHGIVDVIASIHVVDVYRVGILPSGWPRLSNDKPISAVLKAWPPFDDHRSFDPEAMFSSEIGVEAVIGDAATLLGVIIATFFLRMIVVLFLGVAILALFLRPITVFVVLFFLGSISLFVAVLLVLVVLSGGLIGCIVPIFLCVGRNGYRDQEAKAQRGNCSNPFHRFISVDVG